MDQNKETAKKAIEFLWVKINNAILQSEEVQKVIRELEKAGELDSVSEYDLILDAGKLTEKVLEQKGQNRIDEDFWKEIKENLLGTCEGDEADSSSTEETPRPLQRIDGKVLSENEIMFQDYMNESFNEKSWLKQSGIKF
ncbi:MAG: hypothetical protein F3743_11235 [Nitrospinae bacterium]|nr:hypothetical protein [Nitrospinota bacterium]MZH13263.1 hypothetical protein [Nitrospinota bacterium]